MHKRWAAGEDWRRTGRGLTQTKKLHNILLAEELLATQFGFDDTFAAAQLQNRIRMKRTNEQTNRSFVRSFVRSTLAVGVTLFVLCQRLGQGNLLSSVDKDLQGERGNHSPTTNNR